MPHLHLTAEQQKVIQAPLGHYVIRAVAGSGKTTTLAYRIRHLLEEGVEARRILVLMFNKSAQTDFAQKLHSVVPAQAAKPEVRTFHAMGYRLYRKFIDIGALPAFHTHILSDREIQFQLLQITSSLLSPDQQKEFKRNKKDHLDVASGFIDQCKGQLLPAREFFNEAGLEEKFAYLPELFDRFEEWRRNHYRISYSDMLYDPVQTLINRPELQELVRDKMDAVLVDEYQDTNDIQHALLGFIAGKRANVTIVGDPDQTIYEFRGAKPQYMVAGFAEEYAESEALYLSTSFRYGHQVALLANQLIAHSPYSDGRLCVPGSDNTSTKTHLYEGSNENDRIVRDLKSLDSSQLERSAVLLRIWSQSAALELILLKSRIPYKILGHGGIFGTPELAFVRGLLELATGAFQQLDVKQRLERLSLFCKFPHVGVGESKLLGALQIVAERETRFGYALLHNLPDSLARIQRLKLERLARALTAIENNSGNTRKTVSTYKEETKLFSELKNMGLSKEASEEQAQVLKSLIEFVASSKTSPSDTLQELEWLEQQTTIQNAAALTITTIHRAKGLEWDHVFVPGLSQENYLGRAKRKGTESDQIASERRLLYVAITRAKQSLFLYTTPQKDTQRLSLVDEMRFAESKTVSSAVESQRNSCSFSQPISEMSQRYAEKFGCKTVAPEQDIELEKDDQEPWKHARVKHDLLGHGRVVKEEASTFTVEFNDQERRIFSKRHAQNLFSVA